MREIRFLSLIPLLLVVMVGCSVNVNKRDDITINNMQFAKQMYQEDIARTAGLETPDDLDSSKFPIGSLTWEEYESDLSFFDSAIFYEKQKKNPDEEAENGK